MGTMTKGACGKDVLTVKQTVCRSGNLNPAGKASVAVKRDPALVSLREMSTRFAWTAGSERIAGLVLLLAMSTQTTRLLARGPHGSLTVPGAVVMAGETLATARMWSGSRLVREVLRVNTACATPPGSGTVLETSSV